MAYLPNYIVKKLEPKEIDFLSKVKGLRQPEFFEMLYNLQIDEALSVDLTDRITYQSVFMTAKRYSKLINIVIATSKIDDKLIIIRKK